MNINFVVGYFSYPQGTLIDYIYHDSKFDCTAPISSVCNRTLPNVSLFGITLQMNGQLCNWMSARFPMFYKGYAFAQEDLYALEMLTAGSYINQYYYAIDYEKLGICFYFKLLL